MTVVNLSMNVYMYKLNNCMNTTYICNKGQNNN